MYEHNNLQITLMRIRGEGKLMIYVAKALSSTFVLISVRWWNDGDDFCLNWLIFLRESGVQFLENAEGAMQIKMQMGF